MKLLQTLVLLVFVAGGVLIFWNRDSGSAAAPAEAGEPVAAPEPFEDAPPERVSFARHIRPILSASCFKCHGPNEESRESDLHLGTKEGIARVLKRKKLLKRITSDDPDRKMPPPDSGKELKPAEIELLVRWIDEGGEWQPHWSFLPPRRADPPAVREKGWPKDDLDRFVLARLEREGLRPAPEASKETLLRRVTFDLTGLPPTLAETDAFLADESPDAYEKVVDRLLASERYGEHRARYWLDAARYGDTHGLHLDNYREMWPYRDWVVGAFNGNLGFDRFVTEQLAGDLLESPTLDQRIASGFNRCHVTTNEGGSINEEIYVRNVADRVDTAGTVFLGLTLACARCHDHKYDPVTQKDYYSLFAFFNSLDGAAMDGNIKDHPPVERVPTAEDEAKLAKLKKDVGQVEARLNQPLPEVDAAQAQWERGAGPSIAAGWTLLDPARFESIGGATMRKLPDKSVLLGGSNPLKDMYEVVARTDKTGLLAIRLDALTHESLPRGGPGRAVNNNFVLSEFLADAVSVADRNRVERVRFRRAVADFSQTRYPIDYAIDGKDGTGWAIEPNRNENRTALFIADKPFGYAGGTELRLRIRFRFGTAHTVGRFRLFVTSEPARIEAARPAKLGVWNVLGPFPAAAGPAAYTTDFGPEKGVDLKRTYADGKLEWTERKAFTDGKIHKLTGENCATYLFRTITTPGPRRAHLSFGSDDAIKVWLNGILVVERNAARSAAVDQEQVAVDLDGGENRLLLKIVNFAGEYAFYARIKGESFLDVPIDVGDALRVPAAQRTDAHRARLRAFYRRRHWPEFTPLNRRLAELREQEKRAQAMVPTTLVYKELMKPRDAFILKRGEYDQRGPKVDRETPSALPPMAADLPRNRLGFARWLLDPGHPLTARVAMNRFWQQLFGHGLVRTAEDFGAQGEPPSHPDLFDYLATQFVADGWDVKRTLKRIVTSATYRQSSRATPELIRRDPENRLLARGPRFRLDAEMLRDQALYVSGLLVEKLGGPGVKPPQPDGLWFAVGYTRSNTVRFVQDKGPEKVYRRSLYTFWKRTAPPPQMNTFDAPSRETCAVRRERTNTPLQALLLLNDPQYVEAARHLARRAMLSKAKGTKERALWMFRLVTARRPGPQDLADLLGVFRDARAEYEADPAAAQELRAVGQSKPDAALDPVEHAAWTVVANLILNLDEVLTKG